jgi:hypothetical protein
VFASPIKRAGHALPEASWWLLETAYVLLLPPALFFAYRVSLINQFGFIDPWIYWGYTHNLGDLIDRFGLTYYSVRFGLIFPAWLFAKLFGAIPGYLVGCYLSYLVAGVPLYLLVRKRTSVAGAALAYALWTSSPWVARTILWTYADHATTVYLLAAACLVMMNPARRRLGYFLVGVLGALGVNSNFFAAAFVALLAVPYVVLHWGRVAATLKSDLSMALVGFALVEGVGALIFRVAFGDGDVLSPTMRMVFAGTGTADSYRVDLLDLLPNKPYVFFWPLLLVASMGALWQGREKSRWDLAVFAFAFAVSAFVSAWQWLAKRPFLELSYYFSFLIVAVVPLLTAAVIGLAGTPSPRRERTLVVITLIALAVPLAHAWGMLDFATLPPVLLLIGAGLTLIAVWLPFPLSRFCGALGLVICWQVAWQDSYPAENPKSPRGLVGFNAGYYDVYGADSRQSFDLFKLGLGLLDAVPSFRDSPSRLLFWYPNADTAIHSIQSSYLWGYSRLSGDPLEPGMPFLSAGDLTRLRKSTDAVLVLLARDESDIERGISTLAQAGTQLVEQRRNTLCAGTICLRVRVLKASFKEDDGDVGADRRVLFSTGDDAYRSFFEAYYGTSATTKAWLHQRFPDLVGAPTIRQRGDADMLVPTTRQDHLATQFFEVPAEWVGAEGRLGIDFRFRPKRPATPGCRYLLQDTSYATLLEGSCAPLEGTDHLRHRGRLVALPARLRLVLMSQSGLPVPLPDGISVDVSEQAGHRGRLAR